MNCFLFTGYRYSTGRCGLWSVIVLTPKFCWIMDIIFKDFVYDENNRLRQNEDGDILCTIRNFEGEEDTDAFLDRETLISSNILPREDDGDGDAHDTDEKEPIEWSEDMTRMILDKYSEYIGEVGPMKKFRTKKKMWEYMTNDVNIQFKINRTAQQLENRFKTVLKRKKKAVSNNSRSGSQRNPIQFEAELNKIANVDDSIEPEVMKDQNQTTTNSKINEKGEKRKHFSLSEVFKTTQEKKLKQQEQLHKEKEENKERRHKEILQLLKDLFNMK